MSLRTLDLFSGIGGFSLGLERTGGFHTVAFCECEPFCRAVLKKHWPEIPCYDDVRTLSADRLVADGIGVDVICGGFPCQDISLAGKGAGLAGARSGLWSEYHRIIEEIRPQWVIIENVSALRSRGLEVVLGQLAAIRYDTEWHCIPACAVGAPHQRDRIWIVAYPRSEQHEGDSSANEWETAEGFSEAAVADTASERRRETRANSERHQERPAFSSEILADPDGPRLQGPRNERSQAKSHGSGQSLFGGERAGRLRLIESGLGGMVDGSAYWLDEPHGVPRVASSIPDRAARLRAIGNSVVPQVVERIGRSILAVERKAA